MKTSLYVTELSYLRKHRLSEDAAVTDPIDPTANTGPSPGPNPSTSKKEKPAPDSAVKPKANSENKPKSKPKEDDAGKSAFFGGVMSDVGSHILQKVYGVASGDIYHIPQSRVGNNPAYTGSGMGN